MNNGESIVEAEKKIGIMIERIQVSDKIKFVKNLFQLNQKQMVRMFRNYAVYDPSIFSIQQILNSQKSKLLANQESIFFGEIIKNQKCGRGISLHKQGKIYEGYYFNNKKDKKGVEIYPSGNLYIGQFFDNKKHGSGKFIWYNSNQQDKEDQPIVFPKYRIQLFQGQWWGGYPSGKGEHIKSNGDIYIGQFKNGLRHGQGQEYFNNKDYYKGKYINGYPEGYGEYLWADGSYFKGQFKQGIRSGFGLWKKNEKSKQSYRGNFLNDKKNGYGLYKWDDGSYYKGTFFNDLRHGQGQLYHNNKLIYKGQWRMGQKLISEPLNNKSKNYDIDNTTKIYSDQTSPHSRSLKKKSSEKRANKNLMYIFENLKTPQKKKYRTKKNIFETPSRNMVPLYCNSEEICPVFVKHWNIEVMSGQNRSKSSSKSKSPNYKFNRK